MSDDFRLRNDLYCVGWGVKLYSLSRYSDDSSVTVPGTDISLEDFDPEESSIIDIIMRVTQTRLRLALRGRSRVNAE